MAEEKKKTSKWLVFMDLLVIFCAFVGLASSLEHWKSLGYPAPGWVFALTLCGLAFFVASISARPVLKRVISYGLVVVLLASSCVYIPAVPGVLYGVGEPVVFAGERVMAFNAPVPFAQFEQFKFRREVNITYDQDGSLIRVQTKYVFGPMGEVELLDVVRRFYNSEGKVVIRSFDGVCIRNKDVALFEHLAKTPYKIRKQFEEELGDRFGVPVIVESLRVSMILQF